MYVFNYTCIILVHVIAGSLFMQMFFTVKVQSLSLKFFNVCATYNISNIHPHLIEYAVVQSRYRQC